VPFDVRQLTFAERKTHSTGFWGALAGFPASVLPLSSPGMAKSGLGFHGFFNTLCLLRPSSPRPSTRSSWTLTRGHHLGLSNTHHIDIEVIQQLFSVKDYLTDLKSMDLVGI
jgi:hypothetical protein